MKAKFLLANFDHRLHRGAVIAGIIGWTMPLQEVSLLAETGKPWSRGLEEKGLTSFRGQFGYRKLLYYKGFPGMSTPVLWFLSARQ